ncbi:MAG: ATP-binding cassette domain-containing protein [Myxococcota bacterium]
MELYRLIRATAPIGTAWAVVAGTVCALATVGVLNQVAAVVASGPPSGLRGLGMVAVAVGVAAANYASEAAVAAAATRAVHDLRRAACAAVARAPLEPIEADRTAVVAALTDDVREVADALPLLPQVLIQGCATLACFAWLGFTSPVALLALAPFVVVGVPTYRWLVGRGARSFDAANQARDDLFALLYGAVRGHDQLVLHRGRAQQLHQDVALAAAQHRARVWRASTVFVVAAQGGALLFLVALGAILFGAAAGALPAGERAAVVVALLYVALPLGEVMATLPAVAKGEVALAHLRSVLASLPAEMDEPSELDPPAFERLVLRGVTRRRRSGDRSVVLGPLDLELRRGELVFVTGGNGSGKSSLLDVLLGLVAPDEGVIEVDGVPVSDRDRATYRQRFAAVPTDPVLGSDRGASRGERKREALADAIARRRSILVLDEVAADQAPEAKARLYRETLPALGRDGATVVLVTHDDRYFSLADRVIHLRDGRILERGSP